MYTGLRLKRPSVRFFRRPQRKEGAPLRATRAFSEPRQYSSTASTAVQQVQQYSQYSIQQPQTYACAAVLTVLLY